ncbi:MAG: PQQ-binding-like beta-propeller repeat protein [Chthoniobacter sp.]|uniref:outer membrane protein assembly factor BamB family protein n=1 Tax=Chthoniobacter sp. TaxID=2510640 RepID=UPI0032AD2678
MTKSSPLLATAAIFLAVTSAPAADWPAWGGCDLGRNMVSMETGLPDTFKPGEKSTTGDGILPGTTENVRWVAKLGTFICGNPTVADGRVFIGTDDATLQGDTRLKRSKGGMVWCLDEKTGQMLWKLPVPVRPKERLPVDAHYGQQNLGVCSSPTIVGNRAYVVTSAAEILCLDVKGQADGNDGPFQDEGQYIAGSKNPPVALEKTDGDIIWKYDLVDDLGICPHDVAACSVLVDGDILYCTSANGVNHEHTFCLHPDAPSFIALDARTGKLIATDTEDLGHRMWHCLWSPPTIGVVNGKKLVFFGGGDGVCYAFEALQSVPSAPVTFKKVWSYDCDPAEFRHPEGEDEFNYYIGDKRKKYTTNKDDGLFLGPSEIIASPVFHDGRVYCTIGQDPMHGRGKGLLHCIDASKTGDVTQSGCIWTYDGIERAISSVAIKDGLLYATDLAGHVHCLDEKTGKPYWVYDTHADTWSTPLVADGKVYINTKKKLVVLSAGKEMKVLSEITLGSAAYETPVAANGTLFICSQSYIWAVQQGAKETPPHVAAAK